MRSDPRIDDMRRRIQSWLSEGGATTEDPVEGDPLDRLDADLAALESELRNSYPDKQASDEAFAGQQEQAVLRTVLESMIEGVIIVDMEGRPLIFNAAAREMAGRGPSDTDPANWSQEFGLFRSDGETLCPSEELPLHRALRGELVAEQELVVHTPQRSADRHIMASGKPLRSEDGRQIGAVTVFHDITESREVEKELRRAREAAEESTRAKSAFLANMSHEIRTPLTAVLGFTDLLMDPTLGKSNQLNYIQAVRRNGEHLLALINDVLDLSKLNAQQVVVEAVECSLPRILHEASSVMQVRAHDKGIDFQLRYDTPIPASIRTDPMRVRQILLNLLSNAVKFTREGGVSVNARVVDPGSDSSRVEIAVSDTGIGLSVDEVEELFQPFRQANVSTTRQYGGTGLGLSICHSLAEALGGADPGGQCRGTGQHLHADPVSSDCRRHGNGAQPRRRG